MRTTPSRPMDWERWLPVRTCGHCYLCGKRFNKPVVTRQPGQQAICMDCLAADAEATRHALESRS